MELSPARALALKVVTRVRTHRAYANEVMGSVLAKGAYSRHDIGYGTRLAFQTVACRSVLAPLVTQRLRKPDSFPAEAFDAMLVALCELLYLKQAPHVVVSQGAELVKSVAPYCTGVANAILRQYADARETFPWGDPVTDAGVHGLVYGFPEWISLSLRNDYGFEKADAIMKASNTQAPQYARVVPFRTNLSEVVSEFDMAGTTVDILSDFTLQIHQPKSLHNHPLLSERDVIIADVSSQQAVEIADVKPGERVIEIGCGRGSKTIMLAASARRRGGSAQQVTGVDIFQYKVNVLAEDAARLGAAEVKAVCIDITHDKEASLEVIGQADVVFIDAPCSGLGTLRRHPDKRSTVTEDEVDQMHALGLNLLTAASHLVAEKGRLIYSTCTLTKRENEQVVSEFLNSEEGTRFVLDTINSDELSDMFADGVSADGFFQVFPTEDGPDGHFVARLKAL